MKYIFNWLSNALDIEILAGWNQFLAVSASLIVLLIVVILVQKICTKVINATIIKFFDKTKTQWDDFLVKRKVISALSHFPSALILTYSYDFCDIELVTSVLYKISQLYYIFLFTLAIARSCSVVNDIYQTTDFSRSRSIKGYIQLIQIFIYFIATILIISILSEKDLSGILTGLSAMAAVLMLIFKDTILGFVASIQLSANKMLRPGDWISMPSHNADGTVIDISLNTVKVQNWDKTITTIPTYALVADSFNNWSGMEESGGRRIKRHINIDMTSVRFCDSEMLAKLSKFHLLKDSLPARQKEIEDYNKKINVQEGDTFNGRRQTNLGVFRHYLELYLHQNPNIHKGMTFLVRHLQPTELGLPIEIYVFSSDQRWAYYEAIQADIMDHVLAILPEFSLRVFQAPSGHDFAEKFNS